MSYVINSLVCGLLQDELAEQTLKAVCRKFSTSAKVWLRHISWLLTKDRADAARKVMDKSFDVLPQRKHIKASALPCPAPPPDLSPDFFFLLFLLFFFFSASHCVMRLSTQLGHTQYALHPPISTTKHAVVALAIWITFATCFLGDAVLLIWSYNEQSLSLEES